MSSENFIKNITSKDNSLAISTTLNLIKTNDIKQFEELAQRSEFIFPFLKDKIINNFVKLINKEDLKTVFNFSKIYSSDFEDLIVNSWVKFASEDLTDKILELFENGTDEQKSYCAKYFYYIQDPLAIEYLNKYALSEFTNLKTNCAYTLAKFQDETVLNIEKEIVLKSSDNFEKLSAFEFICAYGGKKQVDFILKNCFENPFNLNIVLNLLDYNPFSKIKEHVSLEDLENIFNLLIENYPENIELNTIQYYEIYDFIEYLIKNKTNYSNNILLIAKKKFREFKDNDIYSFDLDNNLKNELKNIVDLLNSVEFSFEDIEKGLLSKQKKQIAVALSAVEEYNLVNYVEKISFLINSKEFDEEIIAQASLILKKINKIELIDKNIIETFKNENIKALVESCLN